MTRHCPSTMVSENVTGTYPFGKRAWRAGAATPKLLLCGKGSRIGLSDMRQSNNTWKAKGQYQIAN